MGKRKTTIEFIKDAKNIHGNEYDYSKVNYNNNYSNIIIICSTHGEFKQTPTNHLNGCGCPKCFGVGKMTLLDFIEKSNKLHNYKYDYSQIKTYQGTRIKVKIICPIHGEFTQEVRYHLNGNGCKKCSHDNKKSTKLNFTKIGNSVHCNKYDYSLVKYVNNYTKVEILCDIHGKFKQTPQNHLMGKGCPVCCESKGERKIRTWLKEKNIEFEYQKKFKECKNVFELPFDFFISKKNVLIEYDGEQHFKNFSFFGGMDKFKKTLVNDKIKNTYAKNCGINLIRIPYFKYNNIENILNNKL